MKNRKRSARLGLKFFMLSCIVPLLLMPAATTARAQQRLVFNDTLPPPAVKSTAPEDDKDDDDEDDDFIVPNRPGTAGPAEFHRPGVLQADFGYDGSFHAQDSSTQQTLFMDLRFAVSRRLLLEFDLDNLYSQTDEQGTRVTGVGNSRVGLQLVAVSEGEGRPAQAFAYFLTLPTASVSKGLGTGRFDHKFIWLVSKNTDKTEINFNAAYLLQGRAEGGGWLHGGQGSLSLWREVTKRLGIQGEFSGQSIDEAQPRGLYATGALTYKANRRLAFDAGMRFGLNPSAPRLGVFAGTTIGVADFFKKRH
ncbi:MAG TPA: transporter [Pyrinomonadaceae bacterium]|nr:transporter [Pyrinomonadaceae bacterium]